jgi:hypothetical protein
LLVGTGRDRAWGDGTDRLIIIWHAAKLRFHRLSVGDYRFLLDIQNGATFIAAVEAATKSNDDFEAGVTLQHCVAMNVIVDFH